MRENISHFDACYNDDYTPSYDVDKVNDRRMVHTEELDIATQRVIKRTEMQSINRVEEMKNYRCSDFCLENLLSCGVELKPCKLSGSSFVTLDKMEAIVNHETFNNL